MNRIATIVLAGLLLVAGSALGSYAANGGPLLLGKSNTASKTTKLKTTGNGAALSLKSKAGKAPLKVSNSTKVTKLNADLVDGLDGATLRTTAYHYQLTGATASNLISFEPTDLPPGRYHASYAVSAVTTGGSTGLLCQLLGTAVGDKARIQTRAVQDGDLFFTSGSGLLDTTSTTYRLVCFRSGGTSTTIPADPSGDAQLVLTRVDDSTTTAVAGVGGP